MKTFVIVLSIALLAGACASHQRPIVDERAAGYEPARYERDLAECRAYADRVDPGRRIVRRGLFGGAIGAGLGAITGAFFGRFGFGAALGAATGATSGVVSGAAGAERAKRGIIRRCLAGRGYSVLY